MSHFSARCDVPPLSAGQVKIQKARGVDSDLNSGLRLDLPENALR